MMTGASPARLGLWDALLPRYRNAGWIDAYEVEAAAVPLLEAVRAGPEPDATLERLGMLLEGAPELARAALADPAVGAELVTVVGASRALTEWLTRDPEWLPALAPGPASTDLPPRAWLRRETQRRMLAIAARDLGGANRMPGAGAVLADLGDWVAATGLQIASEEVDRDVPAMVIIAMGKWGGRELNYSSDIDLLFVYEDGGEAAAAIAVARAFLDVVGGRTAEGVAFRVDADLRPEGRDGPLARSLSSYQAYYERWADTWEFQALIKARPAAGDAGLGQAFMEMTAPFVYPDHMDPEAVREIRASKGRMEVHTRPKADTEIKRGVGGIRDVEFAIQLLQLVHGRFDSDLRSPNTLSILNTLGEHGYIRPADAADLTGAYLWLRDLEHRIQLYELVQTHELPADEAARERIAKSMAYRDAPGSSALDQFEADLVRHRASVRQIHERIFYRPLLEAFASPAPGAMSHAEAERQLAALGFADIAGAERAFADLTEGLSRRSRLMQQLLPVMLEWLSETPDPDLGLAQLRLLVTTTRDNAGLVASLRDAPVAAERLCRLLGTSRWLGTMLDRIPEALAALGDDDILGRVPTARALTAEATRRVEMRSEHDSRIRSIRRFTQRRYLMTAARDVLGFAGTEAIGRELSDAADAAVAAALWTATARVRSEARFRELGAIPFCVIAMGRWGGQELQFASDLDVLFVYEPLSGDDATASYAARVAEVFLASFGGVTTDGITLTVDPDLRPEGKDGPLVRSLAGYRAYYERWADTWEFQALLKARVAAGDEALGERFMAMTREYLFGKPPTTERIRDVKTMKARIERDRLPAGEDPTFNLKLGRGGLVDVEFLAQLLQFTHGWQETKLWVAGTQAALEGIGTAGLLTSSEVSSLIEAYEFCSRVRNRLYLAEGRSVDAIPDDFIAATRLGRSLGYIHRPGASLREDFRRYTRRARRVVERHFYGEGA